MLYRYHFFNLTWMFFIAFVIASGSAVAQNEKALERIELRASNKPLDSLSRSVDRVRDRRPAPRGPREIPNLQGPRNPLPNTTEPRAPGATLQNSPGSMATTVGSGFPGLSNNDNANLLGTLIAPPDTDGSVGPNHYMQMINLLTGIFDKNGNLVIPAFGSNAFWDGIGGNCEPNNQGDPIVLYDEVADRWLVSQFAFPDNFSTFSQCVAISQTGDPTGGYNRYEFSFDGFGFNDYPKHGIVTDSVTMIANLFRARGPRFSFAGTFLGVMDKNAMYAGAPASLLGFRIGTGEFGFIAGDLDGSGSAPALFGTAMSSTSAFDIWQIDVDWSTQSAGANRIASVPITPYDSDLCGATREACISQPEGGPSLEAVSDRLMHRLQIRDFGNYRTMVTGHTVDVGGGRAGIRWYEFRESGGPWSLYQEGTYGPADGENRWMPSVAMNAAGDIGIGYLVASDNTYVSTAVTGQSAAQSGSGLLDGQEQICAPGTGVQLDTGRSGDYSHTSVDPVTDSFWHTNEVFTTTGQFQWSTFVCEFSVGAGGGNSPPTASFDSSCSGLSCAFTDTSNDSDGFIAEWAWDFGDGTASSDQNPSRSYTGDGNYTVTLTVTDDGGATDSASAIVAVDDGANDPPVASFDVSCSNLTCDFVDTSTDSDGSIASWSWGFGDGKGSSTTQNPSYSYDSGGSYAVTLTVVDDGGASGTRSSDVTVDDPPVGEFTLSASGFKNRGIQNAALTWTGAASETVDIYRDGTREVTTVNDGAYEDNIGQRGGGSYTYQVCEAGTTICSNPATVAF